MLSLSELYDVRLQYHGELNQALWDGEVLKRDVLERLRRAADLWTAFARVPKSAVRDVVITGGNVNYNWTPYSDIDVHVVADKKLVGLGDGTDDYLKTKKKLWALTHHIEIRGFPLEMYVQDTGEGSPAGQGVYSIANDSWVQKPVNGGYDFEKDEELKRKAEQYAELIGGLLERGAPIDDFRVMKERIKTMRSEGIRSGGEYGTGNLVFKSLRNNGLLDRMSQYVRDRENAELSLR